LCSTQKTSEYVWHFGGKKRDLLNYVIMHDDTISSIRKEDKLIEDGRVLKKFSTMYEKAL